MQWFHGWMLDYMDLDDISKHLKGRFKGAFPYVSRSYFGRGAKKGLLVGFYYYFYYYDTYMYNCVFNSILNP